VITRFLRGLVAESRAPFLKICKFIRFDLIEMDDWLDTQRVKPEDDRSL